MKTQARETINIEHYTEGLQQEAQLVQGLEGSEGLLEESNREKKISNWRAERGKAQTLMRCLGNAQERVVEFWLTQGRIHIRKNGQAVRLKCSYRGSLMLHWEVILQAKMNNKNVFEQGFLISIMTQNNKTNNYYAQHLIPVQSCAGIHRIILSLQ